MYVAAPQPGVPGNLWAVVGLKGSTGWTNADVRFKHVDVVTHGKHYPWTNHCIGTCRVKVCISAVIFQLRPFNLNQVSWNLFRSILRVQGLGSITEEELVCNPSIRAPKRKLDRISISANWMTQLEDPHFFWLFPRCNSSIFHVHQQHLRSPEPSFVSSHSWRETQGHSTGNELAWRRFWCTEDGGLQFFFSHWWDSNY